MCNSCQQHFNLFTTCASSGGRFLLAFLLPNAEVFSRCIACMCVYKCLYSSGMYCFANQRIIVCYKSSIYRVSQQVTLFLGLGIDKFLPPCLCGLRHDVAGLFIDKRSMPAQSLD